MDKSFKPSILSALVLACASFGDSFLYIALPLNAWQMNVPVVWIGFLLSINRFVRLVANQLFAHLFNHFGFRHITIIAAMLAVASTVCYGISSGIVLWVIARVVWGFCYAALRISSISYSLENKKQGLSLGLSKGLQELGPIIALLAGPVLLRWIDPATTFFIFALASLSAVVISFQLPELKHLPFEKTVSYNIIPSSFNILTFLSSFFIQGILIVAITMLLRNQHLSITALTTLAAAYLVYRRICMVFVSPFGGMLADKFGIDKVYLISLFFTITGMFLIATSFTKMGIFIAFTSNSITAALAPGNALSGVKDHLKAIAANSTWSDIGAATGAFIAGSLLLSTQLTPIFFIATFVLLGACIFHIKILKWK